jgi:dTDP-4-dehydrorhamnose reductase
MKILILGGAGMLGHKLFQHLRREFPGTLCTIRHEASGVPLLQGDDVLRGVDAADHTALRGVLSDLRPDYVINCVGVIKQRKDATSAIPSITINSLLPHQLADLAGSWGGRLIHFSTDCVFSGHRGGYAETDLSDAEDLYGKSKFLGEVTEADNALTLRTSIIGRELTAHQSLLDWLLSQHHRTIRGFSKVIYSGITTNQMAVVVTALIREHPSLSGLYQVVSAPITKCDLLGRLKLAYGLDVTIVPDDTVVSDRSMRGDKLREATGYVSPAWDVLVKHLASDPTPYQEWITA